MTTELFISEDYIKESSVINENIDVKVIRPIIIECQDIKIHPLLGTDLYNAMKTKVSGSTVTGVYKTLMDDYLQPTLRYYVLAELIFHINYRVRNKNVARQGSDNSTNADMNELEKLESRFMNKAEVYAQRMINYLCENESSFPEYTDNTDGDDIHPSSYSYQTGIWLGKYKDYKSLEEKYED